VDGGRVVRWQRIGYNNGGHMDKVEVYRGWCKKCGICIAFCPRKALEEDEDSFPVLQHPEKCTSCGLCEMRCPDFAIVVTEENEDHAETGAASGK
jgi:2-oxoglutarate ferredoxin oxidoreductase subunit delta